MKKNKGKSRKSPIGEKQRWAQETLQLALARTPERNTRFTTVSDAPIEALYTAEDVPAEGPGMPGEYPFTRGIHPTMYRSKLWTMRQFSGFGSAHDTNKRYRYLLSQGQDGLSVAFDLPTLMGLDSDDPLSLGEVGREGVAVDTIEDMEVLFDGINLGTISTSMTINAPAAVIFAMYLAVARKRGVPWKSLRGTLQNDILKEYIAQKEWIYPPRPSVRLVTDLMAFAAEEVPLWNTVSISGYHIREAGSTALQELAFTLSDGITYVQAAIDAGLDVDVVAGRLSFFFNAHIDFFEEICKLRAARRLWARIMRERFCARNPRSWMLRTHVQTAGCSLTAQQPYNNIVRVALQALSAVLGGTQSLHANSLDEALALPSEEAVTIALRTQQIIAEESGVANTIDPLAGSYFVERLTADIESAALAYIRRIDAMGGMIAAIERGFPQKEISTASFHYQQQIEKGVKAVVGVSKYVTAEERPLATLKIDHSVEQEQVERLRDVRAKRDNSRHQQALQNLAEAAAGRANLIPHMIEAVSAHATVGEICASLKPVFGVYTEIPVM